MFGDLSGKTALVTGASAGLGAHFALLLAGYGVHVILGARRIEPLADLRARILADDGSADVVELDVTNPKSVDAAFAQTDLTPDIVVNNAGVSDTIAALEMTSDHWDQVLNTNLRGSFLVAQMAARKMRDSGKKGSIINIASIVGLRPAGNVSAYAASKAGVIHLTKSLALEWARHGIRVNALCPGYIETKLNRDFFATPSGEALIKRIPQRRLGRADELDGALLLFASKVGSYINGSTLAVDGGHLVSSL
jgi:NAD(P)-dependent dehydrogenase (short-subunit alcohol dehydrogenase family)